MDKNMNETKIDKIPVKDGLPESKKRKKSCDKSEEKGLSRAGEIGRWFQTICFMNIPVIGVIYMIGLLISRKTPKYKKNFVWGYFIYRILVLTLAGVILYCLYKAGISLVDAMLGAVK